MEHVGLDWDVVVFFAVSCSFNNWVKFSVDPLSGLHWDIIGRLCSWSGNRYKQGFSWSGSVNRRDNWFSGSQGCRTKGCQGASLANSWSKESFLHTWMWSRWIFIVSGGMSSSTISMGHRLAYSAGLCGQKLYYPTDSFFQNCKANCLVNNIFQGNLYASSIYLTIFSRVIR